MFRSLLFCGLVLLQFGLKAQTILVVAAYPAVDQIVKDALVEWKKTHPQVEVKVLSRAYSDHHTAMTTALATSSGLPDIVALEYGYLGRFAQSGGLEDLEKPPYDVKKYADQFVKFAFQQGYSEGSGQFAIPTDIGPGALFYRVDLLDKAGVKEADLLKSWESFIQAGEKIKSQTGAYLMAHARDIKDIMIRTKVLPDEGIYFDKEGHTTVESDRFVRAFTLAKVVRDKQLDGKINAWSNEWGEALKRGTVASQMMGAWLAGHLANWLAKDTSGKWRSAVLPEGANASWGGSFFAISKKTHQKDLAWDLVRHLTLNSDQQQSAFVKQDAFPALLKAQQGPFFEQPIPFLGGQKARLQWRQTASSIVPTKVFKHDAIAEEIVNSELDLVLTKNKPIAQALADAGRMISRRSKR
ncbi:MAG: extracellular solute-binding protein [Gammaproteobacteria bacterium]|nr:extracellular solute-binding protein [Gammaproteobacteria bacterium]